MCSRSTRPWSAMTTPSGRPLASNLAPLPPSSKPPLARFSRVWPVVLFGVDSRSEGHVDEGRAVVGGASQDLLRLVDAGLAEASLGLDDRRQQAHVSRRRDAGH